jgi:ankyrin repeat protein
VNWLLEEHIDLSHRNFLGQTPFFLAVAHGSLELIESLVSHGVDVGDRDLRGNSALHIALKLRRYEIAKWLLDLRIIDLNCRNFDGETFLMIGCDLGDFDLVRYLLDLGADPSLCSRSGRTILHFAIRSKNSDLVRFLASRNVVDATIRDSNHFSSLHFAAASGSLPMIQAVLPFDNIHLNDRKCGYTPLHLACKHNSFEVVQFLCSIPDIDIQAENLYGVPF